MFDLNYFRKEFLKIQVLKIRKKVHWPDMQSSNAWCRMVFQRKANRKRGHFSYYAGCVNNAVIFGDDSHFWCANYHLKSRFWKRVKQWHPKKRQFYKKILLDDHQDDWKAFHETLFGQMIVMNNLWYSHSTTINTWLIQSIVFESFDSG